MKNPYLILDFDSTFVSVEALDELAKIALVDNQEREQIVDDIEEITRMGMEGSISFSESLGRRVKLFSIQREHIEKLVSFLKSKVSESIAAHTLFLRSYADRIFIISGGFREYIVPVVEEVGIDASHVFANTFVFDESGSVTGFDTSAFLAQDQGKVKQLAALGLSDEIWVIGDGYTDFQMRQGRMNCLFFAYTENVLREKVVERADIVVKRFEEVVERVRKLS